MIQICFTLLLLQKIIIQMFALKEIIYMLKDMTLMMNTNDNGISKLPLLVVSYSNSKLKLLNLLDSHVWRVNQERKSLAMIVTSLVVTP